MPYQTHLRLQLSGLLGTPELPVDDFSLGVNTSFTIGPTGLTVPKLDAVVAACTSYWTRGTTRISHLAVLQEVKLTAIGTDGKATAAPFLKRPVNVPGSVPGGCAPFQVAIAVTLGAESERRRAKGRFYLPLPAMGYTAGTNTIPSGDVQDLANSSATFVQDLNAALGEKVVVASGVDGNHEVHLVRVGNVYDTQRRRRNHNRELYSIAPAI